MFTTHLVIGAIIGAVLWFAILEFIGWFKCGTKTPWACVHAFVDEWKLCLILIPISVVLGVIATYTIPLFKV